ncbi:MAG TPA: ABC transporter permease [Vicinamibacterales bacterium]|nr:ABC transporter permease [Vicinamibacterales bacterium]
MSDLRLAIRSLRKRPLFALVAVATMALGVGANAAIFSLVYRTLLRPLPVANADRLVFVWNTYGTMLAQASVSIPDYLDRKTQAPSIEDATLFTMRSANLNEGGNPEQVTALAVTPSFFSTLGVHPILGQGFTAEQATPNADKFVILSHGLWQSHYAADRTIVGKDIRINTDSYRVVGVMPADFDLLGRDLGVIFPFAFTPQQMSDNERGNEFSQMIALLRPGATIEAVDKEMQAITDRVIERLPARAGFMRQTHFTGYALPIRDQLVGDVRPSLLIVQACVGFVLLIACANVANLLLMRATQRQRELAIRSALGAGRWRIARQLVAEGLVLSAAGGLAGVVVAIAGVRALVALAGDRLPGIPGSPLDPVVLGATFGLVLLTGVIFGLVPALAATRGHAADDLKNDTTRGTASRRVGLFRASMVVCEVAAALILLTGAGLLIKSLYQLQAVSPGFTPDRVLTAQIALPAVRYPDAASRVSFWNRLLEQAAVIPGVTSAGLTTNVPFNGNVSSGSYSIVGYTPAANEPQPHGRQEIVGGDYFTAMKIPLRKGRYFTASDTATAPPVCIIDEYLVDRYFKDRDPIGQQIRRGGPTSPAITIVGVVGTISTIDLAQPVTKERLYYPVAQQNTRGMAVILKASGDTTALTADLRRIIRGLDPEQPIAAVRTMDEWMARSLAPRSAPTVLLTVFGVLALVLSAIGIYGVLAFGVEQRVREFGIRQALGAGRPAILRLVFRQGLLTVGIGVAIGLAGSLALSRYLESLLFGVTTRDVAVLAAVTALLLLVAAAACYLPARKATRADPLTALRAE